MPYRAVITVVAAAIFGMACVSTDAFAFRGGARGGHVDAAGMHAGVYRGGAYHSGVYRGAYAHRGWGVGAAGVGAAAVGAAVAAPYYYNSAQCGYSHYPPCY
jgi:hypothetical protein